MKADLLIDSQCALGEGATWCAATGRFYWTEIEGERLWRYDPRDASTVSFPCRNGLHASRYAPMLTCCCSDLLHSWRSLV